MIQKIHKSKGYVAAICAAPIVLSKANIMNDINFTCFPSFETQITEGNYSNIDSVVIHNKIITGKGPGVANIFALTLVEVLTDKVTSNRIKEDLQLQ